MTEPRPPEDLMGSAVPFGRDRLLHVTLPTYDCRLLLVDASSTAFEAEFRHLAGRVSAEAIGRLAAAAVLLGADLKDDERLAIQMRCEGPLLGYLVEVDAGLRFRGYTQKKSIPDLDPTQAAFTRGIGSKGRLQVIRSTGRGIVYQGITELASGDVASDLERSLLESQQIPSRLLLDHGYQRQLAHAVGILLQALPGASLGAFDMLAAQVAARADAARPFTRDLEALADAILPPSAPRRVLDSRPVSFGCACSRVRVIEVLKSLGPPQGESAYPPTSRVTCAFCNDTYEITSAELS